MWFSSSLILREIDVILAEEGILTRIAEGSPVIENLKDLGVEFMVSDWNQIEGDLAIQVV